jgi:hypothetical protein
MNTNTNIYGRQLQSHDVYACNTNVDHGKYLTEYFCNIECNERYFKSLSHDGYNRNIIAAKNNSNKSKCLHCLDQLPYCIFTDIREEKKSWVNINHTLYGSEMCINCGSNDNLSREYTYNAYERLANGIEYICDIPIIIPPQVYLCIKCYSSYESAPSFKDYKRSFVNFTIMAKFDNTLLISQLQQKLDAELQTVKKSLIESANIQKEAYIKVYTDLNKLRIETINEEEEKLKNKEETIRTNKERITVEFEKSEKEVKELQEKLTKVLGTQKRLKRRISEITNEIVPLEKESERAEKRIARIKFLIKEKQGEIETLTKTKKELDNFKEYIGEEMNKMSHNIRNSMTMTTKTLVKNASTIINEQLKPLLDNDDHTKIECFVCRKILSKSVDNDDYFTEVMVATPCMHKYCKGCSGYEECHLCKKKVKKYVTIY